MHGSLHLILANESARVRVDEGNSARRAASFRRPLGEPGAARRSSARHPPARSPGSRRFPPRPVIRNPGSVEAEAA